MHCLLSLLSLSLLLLVVMIVEDTSIQKLNSRMSRRRSLVYETLPRLMSGRGIIGDISYPHS